ncbi:YihY/virulence factor BrkB family protein [Amnibacterium endophyticum]|uniref:YihY/virulence factor BrkB family protein n=1 Tax=Amnibacterium endophyticum TaxID=2109337 RepID=A0ABW4LCV7_9MICO
MTIDRGKQGVRDAVLPSDVSGAKPDPVPEATGIAALIQRVMAFRPVRVLLHYSNDNGPLIASGMTYQAVFALFAALWFTFSVAGFVIADNPGAQARIFSTINGFIPNLIDYPGKSAPPGTISSDALLKGTTLGIGGAISLVGVLFTAIGFLATLRTAIRIMFGLPNVAENFALRKLKDLGLAVAFGAVVVFTAVLSFVSNTALGFVTSLLGLGDASPAAQFGTTATAFLVLAIVDAAILMGAMRILSGIPVPVRRLLAGGAIGGFGMAVLQTVGTSLLGGATSNPVVTVFATTAGVLLYFNFICQVILIASAWVAVGMLDAGIDARSLSPVEKAEDRAREIEDARRLVARANQEALEQRAREARGLRRWRLTRELQREVRAEARRRERVPTVSEFTEARTGAIPVQDGRRDGSGDR